MDSKSTASTVLWGAIAGVVASAVMGMFGMVAAATYQGTGIFTPLYHIASPISGGDAMMASMQSSGPYFDGGPALLGLALHMMTGAAFGVIFFLIARAASLRGFGAGAAGVAYGLGVMLLMAFVGLPIVASAIGGGDPVREMAQVVGWSTFAVEHAMFGAVLGVWVALRPADVGQAAAGGGIRSASPG